MKKIIALLLALTVSATVIVNSFKANAIAVPVSLLTYLMQACSQMLVGSGVYTQSQVNDMSTSDILNNAASVGPSIDWEKNAKLKIDVVNNINKFINDSIHNQADGLKDFTTSGGLSNLIANKFVDWIDGHVADLPTVNPELKGFGAMAIVTTKTTSDLYIQSNYISSVCFYYGTSGFIKKDTSGNPVYANISGDNIIRQYIEYSYSTGEAQPMREYNYSGTKGLGGAFHKDSTVYSETKFIGDWRYEDGTLATDMLTFVEEVPESIGTVDIDGTTYDVNGDGTITIGDETIPINDDGTVTINGDTYYPDYDLTNYDPTSITNLVTTIINNIDVIDDTTDDELVDDIDVTVPQEIADSELSSLTMPKTIATVFPFCIPWDFYKGIKMLSDQPEAPKFEVPFEIPEYGSFPGYKKMIVIDFSEYSSAFAIVRWTFFVLFMFGICFITFKIVKGA